MEDLWHHKISIEKKLTQIFLDVSLDSFSVNLKILFKTNEKVKKINISYKEIFLID